MTVDKQTAALLEQLEKSGLLPMSQWPIDQARRDMAATCDQVAAPKVEVGRVEDRRVPVKGGEITVRLYWPEGASEGQSLPVMLYYHGGGFVLGNLEIHDHTCRQFCRGANIVVANVDYRLAPEHKFPTGIEDAYQALEWVQENADQIGVDPGKIILSGDSAGGNFTIALSLMARDRRGPAIAAQIPIYPSCELGDASRYASREKFGKGEYYLMDSDIDWLLGQYFKNAADAADFRASPIRVDDLRDLPPAFVLTAGYDPLVDEGEEYARRLREAGVPVDYKCYESTVHGFVSFAGVCDVGMQAINDIVAWIVARFPEVGTEKEKIGAV